MFVRVLVHLRICPISPRKPADLATEQHLRSLLRPDKRARTVQSGSIPAPGVGRLTRFRTVNQRCFHFLNFRLGKVNTLK
jgi:hypothetical protein